jgi:TonB family protein
MIRQSASLRPIRVACAVAATMIGLIGTTVPAHGDPRTDEPCGGYSAELLASAADRAELRIVGLQPYAGDVTVLGRTRRGHVTVSALHQVASPRSWSQPMLTTQLVTIRSGDGVLATRFHPPGAWCDVSAVAGRAVPPDLAFVGSAALDVQDDTASTPKTGLDAADDETYKLSCWRQYIAPRVVQAVTPEMPAMAQQQGIAGRVVVLVTVDVQGNVKALRIYGSPSPLLNNSAMAAARNSRYQGGIVHCLGVPTTFAFAVDYSRI